MQNDNDDDMAWWVIYRSHGYPSWRTRRNICDVIELSLNMCWPAIVVRYRLNAMKKSYQLMWKVKRHLPRAIKTTLTIKIPCAKWYEWIHIAVIHALDDVLNAVDMWKIPLHYNANTRTDRRGTQIRNIYDKWHGHSVNRVLLVFGSKNISNGFQILLCNSIN